MLCTKHCLHAWHFAKYTRVISFSSVNPETSFSNQVNIFRSKYLQERNQTQRINTDNGPACLISSSYESLTPNF